MATVTLDSSTRRRFLGMRSVVNAMLIFLPLALVGEQLHLGGVFVFTCAALACIPLSYWLGQATEALGTRLGPVSGGLLNATCGNAAELIISIFALSHGLFVVVRAALIGSILGQLLLVLGTSLLLAGIRHGNLRFSRSLVQANFSLMAIALAVIGLPAILLVTSPEADVAFLAPTLAIMLIAVYALAVFFSLRTQPVDEDKSGPSWTLKVAMLV